MRGLIGPPCQTIITSSFPGRSIGEDRTVSGNEVLQAGEVRAGVIFIIDFNANAEPLGDLRGINSELRPIGGERLVPVAGVRDTADGEHGADVVAGEITNYRSVHPNGNAV